MKISWKLFKPQGKWMYEGISTIPDSTQLWHDNVLQLLDDNQNDVIKGTILAREFHCVVELIEETCDDNTKFFLGMFVAVPV